MKQILSFKFLMFTLVGAFILFGASIALAGVTMNPASALLISGAVNLITMNTIHVPLGMGFEFLTAGSEYNGEENEEILFRPRFSGKIEDIGFRQIFTSATSKKLTFMGKLGKILMPYAKGFQGGSGPGYIQKKLELEEFKAETAYDKHDYKGLIQEQIVNIDGVKQNDISGTDVMNAEQTVFMDALESDIYRNFWLADKTKTHIAGGDYPDGSSFVATDPDKFYNQIDGVITKVRSKVNLTPNDTQIQLHNITAGGVTTDEAQEVFKAVFRKSNKVLQVLKNRNVGLTYFATDSMIENYKDTLENDGTEAARVMKINGMDLLTYNGIPIRPFNIDEYIDADFAAAFPRDMVMLTTPMNLAMVLNASGGFAETKFWFNNDENENRQRTQFHMGADFVLPELISFAQNG